MGLWRHATAPLFLLAALGASPHALAQRTDPEIIRSEVGLRRDARLEGQDVVEQRVRAAPREVDWKLTLGIAYTHAEEHERIVTTPFQLRARFNEGRTAFKLSGSGYSRVRSDDGTASGFKDVSVMFWQRLAGNLAGEAGVVLPAGGEVGGAQARERLGAIYNHVFSPRWEGLVHGRLTRYDGDLAPGVGRIRSQGLVQIAYNLDTPRSDLLFQFSRTYRPGSSSASSVALAYEFALEQKRRPPMAAVSFTRGLTPMAHDNTIEFDISVRF